MKNIRTIIQVLIALFASAVFCAICVNLCIYADIGSDSITVFEDGLHHVFPITLGTASYIYNASVIIIGLIVARKNIGWTTIAFALIEGSTIDLMDLWMRPLLGNPSSYFLRWIYVFIAIITLAISIALLVLYRNGMNGLDAICFAISDHFHLSYRLIRTLSDGLLIVAGYLMGGIVGLGSIPAVLLTGTVTDFVLKIFKKMGLGIKEPHG
ncbi:MAG: hypothetical protein PUA69_00670 [Erysipelotrichaceae bacterium]|nr:hypothetical protein [Erysipelotrichaceae bacterium]